MKLKELKGRIVYFTMLISMILTFLGLINNNKSNVNTGVILLIHIILSLLNNVFMYQIFKKSEKKEYIKKLLLFYVIVFAVSALDLFLKETRYGASIGSYFGGIIYLDFQFILTLFLENILTISHINAYKTSGGGAKSFIINLFMFTLKLYVLSITSVFIFYFIYKIIVESDGMHYVSFSDYIVFLIGSSILSVIATINYLLTCFNEFVLLKRHIKLSNIGVLIAIFIGLPIFCHREALLKPFIDVRDNFQFIKATIENKRYKVQNSIERKKRNELTKERMHEYIDRLISNYTIATDIKNAKVGDVVAFGKSYTKANKKSSLDSYYYVFDKDGDMLTLISFYLQDVVEYKDVASAETIESYKKYLDTEFYNNAFNDKEKLCIIERIYEDGNSHKVYLPSTKDVNKYDLTESLGKVITISCPDKNLYDSYFCKKNAFNLDGESIKYLLSPHILKPNTIRSIQMGMKNKRNMPIIRDYNELRIKENQEDDKDDDLISVLVYRKLYMRPKITIDISKIK